MPTMRDVFWNEIYEFAKENRNIVILSADFAAPSLDKFRLQLPNQFINLGISKQNMILVATGMALEGKIPFCYAIAPFITMRCFEQTRLYAAGMKLPITLVGVGAGFAYSDSGYTHHALEDISIMRTLPNMKIFQPSDNATTKIMAKLSLESNSPVYLRLDRYGEENLIGDTSNVANGLSVVRAVQKTTILASGNMLINALKVADILKEKNVVVGVVDACIFPIDKTQFQKIFSKVENLITLEEHTLNGGIGSNVLELISDLNMNIRVKRLGLDLSQGYSKEYGGRLLLQNFYGIDPDTIVLKILDYNNR